MTLTRSFSLALVLTALASAWGMALAQGTALAPPPIRLDAQAACPAARPTGTLTIERKAPLAGTARAALQAQPALAKAHADNTQGEEPWLAQATGRSGPNRLYRTRGGSVVILTLCNPSNCPANRAYVAWIPQTRQWGAQVFEGRDLRNIVAGAGQTTLAVHPELIEKALVCAANADMGAP